MAFDRTEKFVGASLGWRKCDDAASSSWCGNMQTVVLVVCVIVMIHTGHVVHLHSIHGLLDNIFDFDLVDHEIMFDGTLVFDGQLDGFANFHCNGCWVI